MRPAVTIRRLPRAFEFVKAMQRKGWNGVKATESSAGRRSPHCCRARWRKRSMTISIAWPCSMRPTGATALIDATW
jgi:hypothetical protein